MFGRIFVQILMIAWSVQCAYAIIVCDNGTCEENSSDVRKGVTDVLPWVTGDRLIAINGIVDKQPPLFQRCRFKDNKNVTYGLLINDYCVGITYANPINFYTGENSIVRWSEAKLVSLENEFLENAIVNIATAMKVRGLLFDKYEKILVLNNDLTLFESLVKHSVGNIRSQDESYTSYIDLLSNVGLLDPFTLSYYKYANVTQQDYPMLIAMPAIRCEIIDYDLYSKSTDNLRCDPNYAHSIVASITDLKYTGPALEYCAVLTDYGDYTCAEPDYELFRVNDVTKQNFIRFISIIKDVVIDDSNADILDRYSSKYEIKARLSEVGWNDTTVYRDRTIDSIKDLIILDRRVALGDCIKIDIVTMRGSYTRCVPDFTDIQNDPPYLSRPICSKLSHTTDKYTSSGPKICSSNIRRQLWEDCIVTVRATYEVNIAASRIDQGWVSTGGIELTPQGYPMQLTSIYHKGPVVASNTDTLISDDREYVILKKFLGKEDIISGKCVFVNSKNDLPSTTKYLTRSRLEIISSNNQWKTVGDEFLEQYATKLTFVDQEAVYQQVIGNCVNYRKDCPRHVLLPTQTDILSTYMDLSLGRGPIRTIDTRKERSIVSTSWEDYFKSGTVQMVPDYFRNQPYTGNRIVTPCKTADSTSYALEGSQDCFFLVDYVPDDNGLYQPEDSYCPENSTLMEVAEINSWGDFYRIIKFWDADLYVSSIRMSKKGLNVSLHLSDDSQYYIPVLQESSYDTDILALNVLSHMFVPLSNSTCAGTKVACTTNSTFYVPPPITTTTLPTTTVNQTSAVPSTTPSGEPSINVRIFLLYICFTLSLSLL